MDCYGESHEQRELRSLYLDALIVESSSRHEDGQQTATIVSLVHDRSSVVVEMDHNQARSVHLVVSSFLPYDVLDGANGTINDAPLSTEIL